MTRSRLAAALVGLPLAVLTLAGCSSGQSMEEACGIVGEQWDKVNEMTAAMESPDDAGWVKDTWNEISDGLSTVSTGDDFMDDAAGTAAEHAAKMSTLVDGVVDGDSGATEQWADTVTNLGTEIVKMQVNCGGEF